MTGSTSALDLPLEIVNTDYLVELSAISVPAGQLLIAFIGPPWGDALSPSSGLDLRRTTPPVADVVDVMVR